ncbi:MAG: Formate-dependent nitrite reductase complex subunit NrfG [Nitrosomonadaceae bacterium]|nr:c-type cytochrome biogenesis protein CcmI [Nitrosospira sp.]MBI0413165.1 c-type cytochrome biogenesis protein CcmI [Nitrosospira sp.]MCG3772058.1 Formate-dependent nitrite reductase complex subunit NrfG [Nitrosomonadaceae bacterium]GDX59682.1 c-type cytochrome biogenesis protein CcmI [Nitrosomonadaceae bacterium]
MTSFWVVAGILTIGALLFIVPTLISKGTSRTGVIRKAANVSIYRDQLAELESDLRSDVLSKEQYDQSKRELQQRMIQDVPEGESLATMVITSSNRGNIATITVLMLAIPLMAVSLYLWIGNTKGLTPQPISEQQSPMSGSGPESESGHQNFSSVLDSLIARLREQPNDVEGWIMLGRTYAIMQRFNEAKIAYEQVIALSPESPELLVDYADIVAMTNGGSLQGEPMELVNKALSLSPKNPKALALAGTAAFEQKNFKQAASYWEKLLVQIPPESKLAQSVKESITEAKSLASGKGSTMAGMQNQAATSNQNSPPPASQAITASPNADSAGATGATLTGTVTLSATLAGKVSPDDTLFIFARATDGPPMPRAISVKKVRDLPASFLLTDGMGARPDLKISNVPQLIISARITKSGKAMPESGDLQGFSQKVKPGDKNINIMIDQQIP